MSTKISSALSASGVIAYHHEEYAANYSSYYSESGESVGRWFGKEAAAFGLLPGTPVTEEPFRRLAYGQDPNTGRQLIEWRPSAEERQPRWVRDDSAWREHLEKLFSEAITDGREVFREHPGGAKVAKSEPGAKQVRSEQIAEHSAREKALLELHRIARETFAANLAAHESAQRYVKERGIRLDTAKEFGLGVSSTSGHQLADNLRTFGPELMEASGLFVKRGNKFIDRFRGRLMFPIENAVGETIAFAGRAAPNDHGPKYVNSPETELYTKGEQLFNLHRASERIAETGQVVIVEGYLDAIAAYQAGVRNVVGASGTALTQAQSSTLAQAAKVAILNLDADESGKRATEKQTEQLLDAGMTVRVLELAGAKDPAEWIGKKGVKAYRREIRDAAPLMSYLTARAREKFDLADVYGRVDATRWMLSTLEHVRPEHREQMTAELETHLQVPKLKAEEAERSKEPIEHRAAWDMTFSAPKTVSLTALVGEDDRVTKAHDAAVWEAIQYAERAIQVKMGGLNAPQTTGRMVAALFRHDTSRPVENYPAPQLHTHAVIFNMSQDRDGQHRALNPKELFYLQSAVEAVYQNSLAVRLKALGYELEYGKNLAIEVMGYTQEYRDAESPRTAEIERKKAEIGQFGPQADSNIALATRQAKLGLTPEQVRALHLEHAAAYGNQPQQVIAAAQLRKGVTYSAGYRAELADEAMQFAKNRLSERTTVMEWHEIHRDALRFGRGYITLRDVEGAFARARERREFQGVSHWRAYAPESRWTTPELEAKEREILGWMAAGRSRAGAIAGQITRDEFRAQFRDHLNDGQKWLVWNVIHSEDSMVGVQGIAGSGKTRGLATIRDFAEHYGYEVRGAAATSGAVAELRAVGIAAETLAAHELRKQKPGRARLYLVDEASLTDVHQMSGFLRGLKPADRVIAIGDTRQHGSVGAGKIFAELQEAGMETFHLKKIVRQREQSYCEVVEHLSQGQIAEALEKLEDRARIHEFANERLRHQAIALWYLRDSEHTLVVSPDNRSRVAISEAIRSARIEAGQLRGEVYRARVLEPRSLTAEDTRFAGSYRVGDVLVYARSSKRSLEKGDRASVVQINRDQNLVTVMRESDGALFTYNPRRVGQSATVYEPNYREFAAGDRVQFTRALRTDGVPNRALGTLESIESAANAVIRVDSGGVWRGNLEKMPHLDWGYVMTSYAAQGSKAERVLVHIDTDGPGVSHMVNQQLIYVGASRGREEVQVFVNSREELAEHLLRREEKATALGPEEVGRYRTVKRQPEARLGLG